MFLVILGYYEVLNTEEYHIIQHNKLKPFIALYSLTHPKQPLFHCFHPPMHMQYYSVKL